MGKSTQTQNEGIDPIRIIILEDNESDRELIESVLDDDGLLFTSKWVDTRSEFLHSVKQFQPDIILSDHSLPSFNSIEALKISKEENENTGFIVVTGTVSEEFAVDCLKQGADDYVLKSNLSRLPDAVRETIINKKLGKIKQLAKHSLNERHKKLIRINRELDSFVYSVSHNLRAPITSVLGLLNLARQEHHDPNPTLEKYHDMMSRSLSRLENQLKELLDYCKEDKLQLEASPISLSKVVRDCFDQVRFLSGETSIQLQIEVNGDDMLVSDERKITMVFENLLSNAIKYRDISKASCYLRVEIVRRVQGAEITFTDNGIGIAESDMQKIFGMFYRATKQSDGSGLGLYIVKQAVDKLNGTIDISSVLGEGTSFVIRLPDLN